MTESFTYNTKGVCARKITFTVDTDTDIITNIEFSGGCSGNTQGLSSLVVGMKVDEVIKRLDGIRCGFRPTSCPDQLANALREFKAKSAVNN